MNLETIALHNLWRRKTRFAFLVTGLLVGVATVVSLLALTSALQRSAQHELETFGANILLTPPTDELSLTYGGITVGGVSVDPQEIAQSDLERLQTIPNRRNIAAVAPKVLGVVDIAGQRVLLMGVDPGPEFRIKRWWSVDGRRLAAANEAVLGSEVAARLQLGPGDTLEVGGRKLEVSGVLAETGSQDDSLAITTLATAQAILRKPGVVSLVEVAALCADCPVEEMVAQISTALPSVRVRALRQVVETRMHALGQLRLLSYAVAAVVILIGALIVLVTMMGSVTERTRELGIFRTVGFRRLDVMRLILFEAAVVSLLSGVLGYGVGQGGAWLLLPLFSETGGTLGWDPVLAVSSLLLAVAVGCLASVYPALRASRLDPMEALRAF